MLNAYDYDHTLTAGVIPEPPYVVISGRTLAEYDDGLKNLAQEVPVYLRGSGPVGCHWQAGLFKAEIINWLHVTTFYEDNAEEVAMIRKLCRGCEVVHVT